MRRALLAACLISIAAQSNAEETRFMRFLTREAWPMAQKAGLSRAEFEAAIVGSTSPDPLVLKMAANQPEFKSTTGAYLAKAVTGARIDKGRMLLDQQAALLAKIEARYGVPREIVLAIWGMESNFGGDIGSMKVIRSLATLAYEGSRKPYGREQLAAAFRVLRKGEVAPQNFVGSWAGAMGHTQFIPTSYLAAAVDWNGDGRKDIWTTPADALASTAHYLKEAGWDSSMPWGEEVKLPDNFDMSLLGRAHKRPMAEWQKLGVRAADGGALSAPRAVAYPILPQGLDGPAFLVTGNFLAIMAYNQSHSYALAVGHLADRIDGRPELRGKWRDPRIDLSLAERIELQRRLNSLGFETGGSDGRFGARTFEAIVAFQKKRGLAINPVPSRKLLQALR